MTADLKQLFSLFGLEFPAENFEYDIAETPCIPYFNSGVILLNSAWRERFVTAWKGYNNAILEKWDSISMEPFHTDQASLTLAVESLGIPFNLLPSRMNLGCHLPAQRYPQHFSDIDPVIIHYHGLFDDNGYITRTPLKQTNRRVDVFNARLRAEKMTSSAMQHIPKSDKDKVITPLRPKIIVGSGWWCDGKDSEWQVGASSTRPVMFFYLWVAQILKCLSPDRIVITDDHSPLKPDYPSFDLIQWMEFDENVGHANDVRSGKINTGYSGFARSVVTGCMYALNCDADYYVYVAQDCLLKGDNFLQEAIGESIEDILIGSLPEGGTGPNGKSAAESKQQSLMIVKRNGMERLITGLLHTEWNDGENPHEKTMERQFQPLGTVQTPPGFYAQNLSQDELENFIEVAGLSTLYDKVVSRSFYEVLQE